MKTLDHRIDVDELLREIERYLGVVEVFRAAGCDVGGIGRREREAMTRRPIRTDLTSAA